MPALPWRRKKHFGKQLSRFVKMIQEGIAAQVRGVSTSSLWSLRLEV